MASLLLLNLVPLPQPHAVYYSDNGAELNRGGAVAKENNVALSSELPVGYAQGNDGRISAADESGISATAGSNPLTNLSPARDGLKRYKVRKGDTITSIAAQFAISKETVQWANAGIRSVHAGDELVILPVTGILYEVKQGDTLDTIAGSFTTSQGLIKQYNADYQKILLAAKGTLILPGVKPSAKTVARAAEKLPVLAKGFLSLPLAGNNLGELHAQNAVDIVNKCGTQVAAAAGGTVIEDEELRSDGASGWNNGYGLFVFLQHTGGIKTRYAHLEKIAVKVGDEVSQGDPIGFVGNTGNTEGPSGCHLHFEVIGAKNPFATH